MHINTRNYFIYIYIYTFACIRMFTSIYMNICVSLVYCKGTEFKQLLRVLNLIAI